MNFQLTEEQQARVCAWETRHLADPVNGHWVKLARIRRCDDAPRLSYVFTPGAIGTTALVRCICGDELDVTDRESW